MRHWAVRIILALLEKELVKVALLKFLGSAAAGGIKGWLITKFTTTLFNDYGKPVILLSIRKGKRIYNEKRGEDLYVALSTYKKDEDWDAYKDTLDKIFDQPSTYRTSEL